MSEGMVDLWKEYHEKLREDRSSVAGVTGVTTGGIPWTTTGIGGPGPYPLKNPQGIITETQKHPPESRTMFKNLTFKGIPFMVVFPPEIFEFFEDLGDVKTEELKMLSMTHPKHYATIKESWVEAYTKVQGGIAFEKD